MNKVGDLIVQLFIIAAVLTLFGAVIYVGFGQSIQQQTNDQANQISSVKTNPLEGTVDIPAITGSEKPSQADTWD
ncbi:hypothetical protein [Brevibacillus choshinensis]|uniref:hypothetical protein n=1 Tax=Brevibacillus choshinensis TaxID=54911 RepID=UPI002E1AD7FD|nr:hypothetical protein [Brevibacillus choshinensis]